MNKKLIVIICFFFMSPFLSFKANCQVFYEDFSKLDTSKWLLMDTKWVEKEGDVTHGGVVSANLSVNDGILTIQGLGALYNGNIKGHGTNKRTGGVLSTKNQYTSEKYEVSAKICAEPDALSAIWTYFNKNDDYNHEIDFEFPGHNQAPNTADSSDLHYRLLTNWRGIKDNQYYTKDQYFDNQIDGKYHTYRFDWHSGGNNEKARVEYYFDNKLLYTSFEHISTHAGNFNVDILFPKWIKEANFEKSYMYVDDIEITLFNEPNDEK